MDSRSSPEEALAAVRQFAQTEVRPKTAEFEAAGAYPFQLLEQLGELGLFGATTSEKEGGSGWTMASYVRALIEVAAADGGLCTLVSIQNSLVLPALLKHGAGDHRRRFLPDLLAGRALGAFALTEADAGSDAAALSTRATRCEGDYVLNGVKTFVTSGRSATVAVVFAVTDPEAGRKGLSAFLVPTDHPGYVVEKVERKLGLTAADTCTIRLENLRLGADYRLGAEGAGYAIALSNLEIGRIGIAAQSVGMARAALEIAIAYAKDRKTFGKPIIEHQAIGFRLAELATQLEAAQQLVLFAATLRDRGEPALIQASMAKLFASEMAERVVSGAIQTLGGYGYLEDYGLAKIYRDVRVCQIYEGASEIQKLIISRSL